MTGGARSMQKVKSLLVVILRRGKELASTLASPVRTTTPSPATASAPNSATTGAPSPAKPFAKRPFSFRNIV